MKQRSMTKILLFIILLVFLVGVISATEVSNNTDTSINTVTDSRESLEDTQEVITSTITEDNTKKVVNNEDISKKETNNTVKTSDDGTFTALQNKIDTAMAGSTITLENDYKNDENVYSTGIKISKKITIDGNGHTIDALSNSRIFNVIVNRVTLKNIKFTNGTAPGGGGAIYIEGDNCYIINSTFTNNIASWNGGAIYSSGTNCYIINSTFKNNKSNRELTGIQIGNTYYSYYVGGYGGAIYVKEDNCYIINSTFTNNKAEKDGGAISNDANLKIRYSTLNNNTADMGGAISNDEDGSLTITGSSLNNNTARQGGAICNEEGTINITRSIFNNNYASYGGAIDNLETFNIVNSTFNNNKAEYEGGAINNQDDLNITKSLLINNTADTGAAIYNTGDVLIDNNTFKTNKANTEGKAIINKGTATIKNNMNDKTSPYNSTIINYGAATITNNFFDNWIQNVTIILTPVKGIIGENITLKAVLTDESGNKVTGGNLAFKLNGKTLRRDGSFNSTASAMKFSVKNGTVTYTIKADLYLRNAKNLTASYSGTSNYRETTSETVTAQIQKRYATLNVKITPTMVKQYETLTIKITAKDATKNGKNSTLISDNTKVMLKINGVTLKDSENKTLYLTLDKNAQATYNYTIPAGTGGITNNKMLRNYSVTAIFVGDNYYPGARNTSYFNVERSNISVNINGIHLKSNNEIGLYGSIRDYKNNYVIGTNKVLVKINGKSLVNPSSGKVQYFTVYDGLIDISDIQVDKSITIKRIMVVTGERQAYLEGRSEYDISI